MPICSVDRLDGLLLVRDEVPFGEARLPNGCRLKVQGSMFEVKSSLPPRRRHTKAQGRNSERKT